MRRVATLFAAGSSLFLAQPALAQNGATAETNAVEEAAIDPARLEAARETVDYLFPLGTYERMMRGTMDQLMDSMLASLGTMRIGDLAGASGVANEDIPEGESERTLAEVSREADPHFEERMQISTRVMMDEMVTLMTAMEPTIRDSLVNIYARKYSVRQLGEMNEFFGTETGSAFAQDYMMVFVDPEMMQSMMNMVPELMQAMPEIMKKVEEATSHLPPVKIPGAASFEPAAEGSADEQETAVEDISWQEPENWSAEDRELVNRLSDESDLAFEKYYNALETAQQNAKARLRKRTSILVQTCHPDTEPANIEKTITLPIETAIRALEGVDSISSTSSRNGSEILVEFDDTMPIEDAREAVFLATNRIEPELPVKAKTPLVISAPEKEAKQANARCERLAALEVH